MTPPPNVPSLGAPSLVVRGRLTAVKARAARAARAVLVSRARPGRATVVFRVVGGRCEIVRYASARVAKRGRDCDCGRCERGNSVSTCVSPCHPAWYAPSPPGSTNKVARGAAEGSRDTRRAAPTGPLAAAAEQSSAARGRGAAQQVALAPRRAERRADRRARGGGGVSREREDAVSRARTLLPPPSRTNRRNGRTRGSEEEEARGGRRRSWRVVERCRVAEGSPFTSRRNCRTRGSAGVRQSGTRSSSARDGVSHSLDRSTEPCFRQAKWGEMDFELDLGEGEAVLQERAAIARAAHQARRARPFPPRLSSVGRNQRICCGSRSGTPAHMPRLMRRDMR